MYVLDASAVLALLFKEPGWKEVEIRLEGALMSAVNVSEVLQKTAAHGNDIDEVSLLLNGIVGIVGLDDQLALETARLWATTRGHGLSLADRACLALAGRLGAVAVTTDRSWGELALPGIAVHVVRR